MATSVKLLKEVERRRVGAKLTQAALAASLGVTQGHYSKVVGEIVPLSPGLAERMGEWLETARPERRDLEDHQEISALARSIQSDARRLAQLVRNAGA